MFYGYIFDKILTFWKYIVELINKSPYPYINLKNDNI